MSYTPIPNPLNVDLKAPNGEAKLGELLAMIVVELRIMNQYLYEMPHRLNAGTDFPAGDEPAAYRNEVVDPFN